MENENRMSIQGSDSIEGESPQPSKEELEAMQRVMDDLKNNMDEFRRRAGSLPEAPAHQKGFRPGTVRQKDGLRAAGGAEKDLEDKISSLKERLAESESKNEKLRRKNGELGNDLARAKARIEMLVDEVDSFSKENEALRRRNRELLSAPRTAEETLERCSLLESENASLKTEAEGLREEAARLKEEVSALEERAAEDAASFQSKIRERDEAIRKLKSGIPLSEIAGTVERTSGTQFRSGLFDCPRYDVRMARNGSYMTFKADVEGGVPCDGGAISIPSLQSLIGFDGPRAYDAYHFNGGYKIVLRRRLRETMPSLA